MKMWGELVLGKEDSRGFRLAIKEDSQKRNKEDIWERVVLIYKSKVINKWKSIYNTKCAEKFIWKKLDKKGLWKRDGTNFQQIYIYI